MWNTGITGSGIKVAVVEHGKIVPSHPNLKNGLAYRPSDGTDAHATQVAGIIASNHSTYRGISWDVPGLLSANFGYGDAPREESRAIAASDWAITNGANILSNSWGNETNLALSGVDKYYDLLAWSNYRTITVAAGNEGQGTGNVQSPGLGYNVITVGGFEDRGDSDWSNDVIWAGSSYKDPISEHMDREKPEVAAVATHGGSNFITTLHPVYPWIRQAPGAGTSYAAPAVAGEAALLMQMRSWLTSWPETVKAVIIASADHNIEDVSRLSEKDGAGGINISKAYDIAYYQRMLGNVLSSGSFPKDYPIYATQGQKVRVVITWDSHPDNNRPPNNDLLQTDLDLYILDPSGNYMSPMSNS